jgi:hypothetical protein
MAAASIQLLPVANQFVINDEELSVLIELFVNYPVSYGYKISQLQRDKMGCNDPSLSYGEINIETIQNIFYRLAVHGFSKDFGGKLVDIGSGLGRILFASILIHDFESCLGIENVPNKRDRRTDGRHYNTCLDSTDCSCIL